MAPPTAQGEYGGVFQLGTAVSAIAGPALVTSLPDRLELVGWLAIAVVFLVGWLATTPSVRWAERTRAERFDRAATR
jgi:predicted MFS family arabinose efflux permease